MFKKKTKFNVQNKEECFVSPGRNFVTGGEGEGGVFGLVSGERHSS